MARLFCRLLWGVSQSMDCSPLTPSVQKLVPMSLGLREPGCVFSVHPPISPTPMLPVTGLPGPSTPALATRPRIWNHRNATGSGLKPEVPSMPRNVPLSSRKRWPRTPGRLWPMSPPSLRNSCRSTLPQERRICTVVSVPPPNGTTSEKTGGCGKSVSAISVMTLQNLKPSSQNPVVLCDHDR